MIILDSSARGEVTGGRDTLVAEFDASLGRGTELLRNVAGRDVLKRESCTIPSLPGIS